MSDIDAALKGVADLYTRGLAEHGPSAPSVGWRDEASHRLRFEKLAQVVDTGEPVEVADWGCGFGALFGFLDEQPGIELARYVGYDISEEMVAAARAQVADTRADFVLGTKLDRDVDYGFVSGTFNVRLEAGEEAWAAYVKQTLAELHARSRRGFAFNLLSTYVDWQEPHLYYADPLHYFDYCKRELSPRVSLLHDYPLYEWTILVRRA